MPFQVEFRNTRENPGGSQERSTTLKRGKLEMKILDSTDDRLFIDFGYCPLVAAWQKLGCTDEEITGLFDIAMGGDRGIAESFGATLALGETIANGHRKCPVRFVK
jgi:hypothetical protein